MGADTASALPEIRINGSATGGVTPISFKSPSSVSSRMLSTLTKAGFANGAGAVNLFKRFWREIAVVSCIFVLGLAVRYPFFFPAVIDWDESTWIIIGQSALKGFLPGEIVWDMKPALVFWWFGAVIRLFGKSIPAIRFAGFLWLVLSAYFLYRAALLATSHRLGALFAAIILIVASSAYAEHVSTEHLALLPLTGAMLVLSNREMGWPSVFLGGVLLGIACLFRLNLVYLCILVAAFLGSQTPVHSLKTFLFRSTERGLWFSIGLLSPFVLSFLPYFVMGRSDLWIGVFQAARSYSEGQVSFTNVTKTLAGSSAGVMGATMWGAAIIGAGTVRRRRNYLSSAHRFNWLLYGTFVLGSFLSIVLTGPSFSHYFVQLVPGLAIFAAGTFIPLRASSYSWKPDAAKFFIGSSLVTLAIFQITAAGWSTVADRFRAGRSLSWGTPYDIADFIKGQKLKEYSIFMLDNQLVYWLLDRYPPTPLATHPSLLIKPSTRNYLEPESKTTEDALRKAFLREPTFVVWGPSSFRDEASGAYLLQQELGANYTFIATIDDNQIFRRKTPVRRKDRPDDEKVGIGSAEIRRVEHPPDGPLRP
jgi:hypothetical protein